MDKLIIECAYEILLFLPPKELLLCKQINYEFYNLCKLESLWRNQIAEMYTQVFNKSSYYETSKLYHEIDKLGKKLHMSDSVENLYESTIITLHDMDIKKIPSNITLLTNLISLNIEADRLGFIHSELDQIPTICNPQLQIAPEICQLIKLQTINIRNYQLEEIPKEISQLTNLRNIRFIGAQLKTIPCEIGKLTNLRFLELSGNKLEYLPKEISQLTNLSILHLCHNNFTIFPEEILKLVNLRYLLFGSVWQTGKLKSIPSEIGKLTNLECLWLDNHQLTQLPKEIIQLTNLRHLNLIGNQISEIPFELTQLNELIIEI